MEKTYYVRDDEGQYYQGHVMLGRPICDGDNKDDALEMTDAEIATDFKSGLPLGWTKEEA